MQNMEPLEEFGSSLKEYIELRIERLKLSTIEKLATAGSKLYATLFIMLFAAVAFVFLLLALMYWIGDLLGSIALGALITGGFHIILLIIVWIFRKRLFTGSMIRSLTKIFFNEEER